MANFIFFITALLVVAADQLTKSWVSSLLRPGQSLIELGFVRITLVHNTGAAFGIFQGQIFPLTIVSILGVILILAVVVLMNRRHQFWGGKLGMVALGLVLGGTIGNLIDRLRLRYVVDFIDFNYWPSFNVADSSVTIGMLIFAIMLFGVVKSGSKPDGR